MSKSLRIRTEPNGNDKFIKVNLEQDFDFIEVLSLKISQKELYTKYCADYGAIIGRVIVNNGFGVPNAKVSVFVPISDIDKDNPIISGVYPFESVTDVTQDGVRYTLLTDRNQTSDECFTPVGSFPTKRKFLDNDELLDVYCEYYKFTTTTNDSGDYMIFGVPIGSHLMHVEADLSDIGLISQKPYDFMRRGATQEVFDSTNKFKANANLDNMINIVRKSPIGVQVMPFWGDKENCDVSITRRDIDLQTNVIPNAIFMGSIFGDNEENSVSLRCKPNENVGVMDGMTTGRGLIEMIRRKPDGSIERFDVSGGQVIDNDGTWAYQIPMNLDYRITDEFGVLVSTDDQNKGIPTKANVRFRIGMDVTGTEGELRTRAKYLVPHNPDTINDVDFNFDQTTKPQSFTTLDWNQVYTVKNYIRKYENGNRTDADVRTFLGIKDVDSARGKYTPFPFNKLNVEGDFMFSLICLIFSFITVMVMLINRTFVALINGIISILNAVLGIFGASLDYIPCLTIKCSSTGDNYAPGCPSGSNGCDAAEASPDDNGNVFCIGDISSEEDAGFMNCLAIGLVESLDLLEWDFYNDWVNGTLYAYLFRHRTKLQGQGQENFCEWSAGGYSGEFTGVDNDNTGGYDNQLYNNYLKDSCYCDPSTNQTTVDDITYVNMAEGLIQKWNDVLYYSPLSYSNGNRLYATDIVTLGASHRCNLKGFPVVQQLFVDTTYNIPTYSNEWYANNVLITSGIDSIGDLNANPPPLIVNVRCLHFDTGTNQCINISRLCELGVGQDELDVNHNPDGHITDWDVDYFFPRNIFAWMNNSTLNSDPNPLNTHCDFTDVNNPNSVLNQDNHSCDPSLLGNPDYLTFRQPSIGLPAFENSFYFYFGLNRNATALSKLRNKYFTICPISDDNGFTVIGDVTHLTGQTCIGSAINITVIGGNAPYTYVWTYPDGTTQPPIISDNTGGVGVDLTDECAGLYTLTVTDDSGLITTTTFIISAPITMGCSATPFNTSTNLASDGQINITIIGGMPQYTVTVTNSLGNQVYNQVSAPVLITISSLPMDTYTVNIVDGASDVCTQSVEITGPPPLSLSANTVQPSCSGDVDGQIHMVPSGGVPPYSYYISGTLGYTATTQHNYMLEPDVYTLTVTDSIGQTATIPVTIVQPIEPVNKLVVTGVGCSVSSGIIQIEVWNPNSVSNPPNYIFHIDSGTHVDQSLPTTNLVYQFTDVPCGNYLMWYTNGNGCDSLHEERPVFE